MRELTVRQVNMTAEELKDWLGSEESEGAGWKSGADEETVGHESGRKIKFVSLQYRRIELMR